jgi:hypothetical protein
MVQCMKINHPFPFGYYVEFFVAFLSGSPKMPGISTVLPESDLSDRIT